MGKGLFCVTFVTCLLASAQPFITLDVVTNVLNPVIKTVESLPKTIEGVVAPVTDIVSGLTNTLGTGTKTVEGLTGTVNKLIGTLGNVTGSLTGSLGGLNLSGLLTNLLNPLINTIVKTLTSTIDDVTKGLDVGSLGNVIQTALSKPLNTVTQLVNTVTAALNPGNLTEGVTSALKPTINALSNLTNQLLGTDAVGCILNSATSGVKGIVFAVTAEILNCSIPKTAEIFKITRDVVILGTNLNFTSQLVDNTTKCLQQTVSSANIGGTVGCVVDPVKNTVSDVTNQLAKSTPLVTGALESVLQIPQCATNALTKAINETTVTLKSIVTCALGKGVNISLPDIPSIIPNFTSIANKTIIETTGDVISALGPNGKTSQLFAILEKLKEVYLNLAPTAVNSVNKTLQSVQEIIDSGSKAAIGKPEALACVSTAQKALNDLAPLAINTVVNCTLDISQKSASLSAQAAAIDIELKTELITVGANLFRNCLRLVTKTDNSIQKCFEGLETEIKSFLKNQSDKANEAINTAQSLIGNAEKCLSSSVSKTNIAGQIIVDQLKSCFFGLGV